MNEDLRGTTWKVTTLRMGKLIKDNANLQILLEVNFYPFGNKIEQDTESNTGHLFYFTRWAGI